MLFVLKDMKTLEIQGKLMQLPNVVAAVLENKDEWTFTFSSAISAEASIFFTMLIISGLTFI